MRVEGLERLKQKLRERQRAALRDARISAVVGYSARHALWVHEMDPKTLGERKSRPSGIGWFWGPADYGAKFLENPARELAPELGRMVRESLEAKQTLRQALGQAGSRLRRESDERVPREYGDLHRSGFVEIENG